MEEGVQVPHFHAKFHHRGFKNVGLEPWGPILQNS